MIATAKIPKIHTRTSLDVYCSICKSQDHAINLLWIIQQKLIGCPPTLIFNFVIAPGTEKTFSKNNWHFMQLNVTTETLSYRFLYWFINMYKLIDLRLRKTHLVHLISSLSIISWYFWNSWYWPLERLYCEIPKLLKYYVKFEEQLILSCIMLKNGQTYFKNLVVWKPQDF